MASRSVSTDVLTLGSSGPDLSFWLGCLPLVVLPTTVVLLVPPAWPHWAYMWALALTIFAGCKWLTWRRTLVAGVPWWRHVAYLLAWPGLDAMSFLSARVVATPAPREWAGAIA